MHLQSSIVIAVLASIPTAFGKHHTKDHTKDHTKHHTKDHTKHTSPCTTSSVPSSSCGFTECVDSINSCGQTYGGCYPACSGFPTPSYSDPGCPSSFVAPISSTFDYYATPSSSSSSCGYIECVDYIGCCGLYGGCYPAVSLSRSRSMQLIQSSSLPVIRLADLWISSFRRTWSLTILCLI